MKKISTLFKKDPNDLSRIIDELNPENEWALNAVPTRKFDGTSCAIIDGEMYKRYDARLNKEGNYKKPVPEGAIPCQEADVKSGHHPHWIKCDRTNNANKYHFEAFDKMVDPADGTYELCGPKVQGNPEKLESHELIKHGSVVLDISDFSFEAMREFLTVTDIEGIVFTLGDKLCKLRKTDFGIKR